LKKRAMQGKPMWRGALKKPFACDGKVSLRAMAFGREADRQLTTGECRFGQGKALQTKES